MRPLLPCPRTHHTTSLVTPPLQQILRPEKALIFRITHIDNIPWILRNGLHAKNSTHQPDFRQIGDSGLIEQRRTWRVPISPGGTLPDYISFYFTPSSIMLLKILSESGLPKSEIVTIVASLRNIQSAGICFLFTDRHANARGVRYHSSLDDIDRISWNLLQERDFHEVDESQGKKQRYQAEALVHRTLPVELFAAIGCYDGNAAGTLEQRRREAGVNDLRIVVQPQWYF